MGMKRATTLAAAAVAVVLAASACGPSDYSASDTAQPAGAAAPAAGGPGNQPGGQLAASTTEQLGPVLTDSAGLTLYRFDKDTAKPPKSNCEGDCAKTWPVVAAGDVTAAAGMDPSLLGEVVRSDGTKQLTVAGWPAYRFNKDAKPGDLKGQGVGGVWFAFGPDGKKAAKGAPAEAAPAASAAPAEAPPAGAAPAQAADGLSVAKDPKLGDHIVDGKGMTVYRFKKDSAWPMVSNCVGDCVAKWPVVPPVDKANAKGITEKNYLVLDRPDGKKQQTIDCWPVYTFSGDKKPGDINGQGVGGTWYAVSPDGKLITVQ
ncbi:MULTISPECIES: SCO0930 family lipoprotein [Streptomyces]|uniref:SCO0930 family lipoprotein n=1 Tax=Streptomyces TaxID=1883 RepID=UPI0004BD5AB6|nr:MULTISPECIES: SCO0930 family lipoprotein [Streptomyces]KJY21059.1 lipoprotein [Streptomyces sp. NRRL S-104]KOU38920.1 lipoprotein [Streptomyces sp. WM6373]KOU74885.1 lipoprotein [Streptomyces sp. XY66]KOU87070.1 lipoprotein [Streptomyces sp. XY58]KOV05847.1 lipoprotein [Streptomyces sp. XY37]